MPTIYDVARRAGVSAPTVSRVLNGLPSVDPVLAERVRSAVTELGYRRNTLARNLRRAQTTLWAVLVSDVENPFFTALVRGTEDVARETGYWVVLCNSDEDLHKEAGYLVAALGEQVAGVIISPASERGTRLAPLLEAGTPVVAVDRKARGAPVDTVLVDNRAGADQAVTHLLEGGYERIACITGPQRATTGAERLAGYKQAFRRRGAVVDQALIRHANFREKGGYQAMSNLLARDPHPDAVFVTNNLMTVGALESISDRNLDVPDDIAVVAFDDIPWAHLVRPTITTVTQPAYQIGRCAGELLAARIRNQAREPVTTVLPTTLHLRESSSARASSRAHSVASFHK
jgi:LacI family transcriptional regulator